MPKYRVTQSFGAPTPPSENTHLQWAQELQDTYGLTEFTLDQIIVLWKRHSESFCAGWLFPHKEGVEAVFGVTLEKIED